VLYHRIITMTKCHTTPVCVLNYKIPIKKVQNIDYVIF